MSECKILSKGAVALFRGIKRQVFLKDLNLSKNEIGIDSVTNRQYNNKNSGLLQIALTQALSTSLQNVIFDQCGLGDHEANAIADALSKNNYLKTLSLKQNGIKNVVNSDPSFFIISLSLSF